MFEIVTTSLGVKSIRDLATREIMHNPVGPWVEANQLYIEQSNLRQRLVTGTEELVVFDVGLGAAANALATLHCAREMPSRRPLVLVSFERELELLRFALRLSSEFAHFAGFEGAIEQLLAQGEWSEPGVRWYLREGDFAQTLRAETFPPHVIFYDPYSPEKNRDMWTLAVFQDLFRHARGASEGGTVFYTYSRATPVRAALLAAGFFVGHGQGTGLKEETTQASTVRDELTRPLGEEWLARWGRSHTPIPSDWPQERATEFKERLLEHPQFSGPRK